MPLCVPVGILISPNGQSRESRLPNSDLLNLDGTYPHFQGMRAANEALTAEGRSAVWVRSKTCFKVFLFINQGETFI